LIGAADEEQTVPVEARCARGLRAGADGRVHAASGEPFRIVIE
jgi:hypothetical protein